MINDKPIHEEIRKNRQEAPRSPGVKIARRPRTIMANPDSAFVKRFWFRFSGKTIVFSLLFFQFFFGLSIVIGLGLGLDPLAFLPIV